MAVDPSGSTIPSSYFYDRGYMAGSNAASNSQSKTFVEEAIRSMSEFQDPRYQATEADKTSFRQGFTAGYNKVYSVKTADYGSAYVQSVEAEEKRVAALKTVEEWENEIKIPNWSIAKAVAANFNVDVQNLDKKMSDKATVLASSAQGKSLQSDWVKFKSSWSGFYSPIASGNALGDPSKTVATVREYRKVLNQVKGIYTKITTTPTGVTQIEPAKQITPPNIGAKASIPGWAILLALGVVGGGGYYFFVHQKKDDKTAPAV